MRHPWWPLIENSSACCGNIKEEEPREIEKERSTAICNVAGMTRREQLDVAGCSCRRLRHQNYFATLISLGGVSPPEDSLLSPFLHRWFRCHLRLSRPFRNSSSSLRPRWPRVVGRCFYTRIAIAFSRLFTIRERRDDVLRLTYVCWENGRGREVPRLFLKNFCDQ